jgi:NADPH-dependent 2,4-dienoyl-CoA reductase/sulfur reductase-like enzyme
MIADVELVVVGAGPAGMEAAVTASELGMDVALVDLSPGLGGQYFQQFPPDFQSNQVSTAQNKAYQFIQRVKDSKIRFFNNTLVWGIFEGFQPGTWCLTLHGPDAPARLNARTVILATGAFDRSVPFPGWDLPGVITAGAALKMIKHQRVLPGKRVILSGTGPLQLQTSAYLVQAGAEVITVCESATALLKRSMPNLPSIWGQWKRLKEGLGFLSTMVKARVPYRLGWAVTSVNGEERVAQATLQKLDINGFPTSPGEMIQDIDTVIIGYGLTPSTELNRQIGCQMVFDRLHGNFVPHRNPYMETSCPGIYAVGDGAGLGGAEMAILEGRIAGYASAARLGHLSEASASE